MLSLRQGLQITPTSSARGLRRAVAPERTSVRELLQITLIHRHYLGTGGRIGQLGYPIAEVTSSGDTASRQYRGGQIQLLDTGVVEGRVTQEVAVYFVGFHCLATSNELSATDEPYFVVTVDVGDGRPTTQNMAFDNVDTNTVRTRPTLIAGHLAPNPLSIRVSAYEQDEGDPNATAKRIQDKAVELSKAASAAADGSGADAADGPGAGPAGAAGVVGGVLAGPIGALGAELVVAALGLGDDFVGESGVLLFAAPEEVGNPPAVGDLQGNKFTHMLDIAGGSQGHYHVFLRVQMDDVVKKTSPPSTG